MIFPVGVWVPKVTAAVATILAGALARRRRELRPLAVWFAAMLAFDVVRLGLHLRFSLDHPVGAPPFEGAARAAWMLDTALYLAWPASLAALCLYYFGERRPWLRSHRRRRRPSREGQAPVGPVARTGRVT